MLKDSKVQPLMTISEFLHQRLYEYERTLSTLLSTVGESCGCLPALQNVVADLTYFCDREEMNWGWEWKGENLLNSVILSLFITLGRHYKLHVRVLVIFIKLPSDFICVRCVRRNKF